MSGNSPGSGKGATHGVAEGAGKPEHRAGSETGAGGPEGPEGPEGKVRSKAKPEWAGGLRQLYDSVLDEPLPDTFRDLLSRLDVESDGGASGHGAPDHGGSEQGRSSQNGNVR